MLRMSARVGFAIFLISSAVWSGFELGCAPASSPPPDEIIKTPGDTLGGTQGSTTTTTPTPTSPAGKCEDFGTLNAASLAGKIVTSTNGSVRDTVALTIDNRPTKTKASILVNGNPDALVGKSAALGVGDNANAFTCTHCVVVAVGCSATSCADATFFFPRSGTAALSAVARESGQPFSGTLTDVELQQVTLDMTNQVMTPVEGGACIHIGGLSFAGTMTTTGQITPPKSDAGPEKDAAGPGDIIGIGAAPQTPEDAGSDATGPGGKIGPADDDGGVTSTLDDIFS